jgi:hypothetical protein
MINSFTKNYLQKVMYVKVGCHSAGTVLVPHDEPAISDNPKLRDKLLVDSRTRWNKLLVLYPFAVKDTNQHHLNL